MMQAIDNDVPCSHSAAGPRTALRAVAQNTTPVRSFCDEEHPATPLMAKSLRVTYTPGSGTAWTAQHSYDSPQCGQDATSPEGVRAAEQPSLDTFPLSPPSSQQTCVRLTTLNCKRDSRLRRRHDPYGPSVASFADALWFDARPETDCTALPLGYARAQPTMCAVSAPPEYVCLGLPDDHRRSFTGLAARCWASLDAPNPAECGFLDASVASTVADEIEGRWYEQVALPVEVQLPADAPVVGSGPNYLRPSQWVSESDEQLQHESYMHRHIEHGSALHWPAAQTCRSSGARGSNNISSSSAGSEPSLRPRPHGRVGVPTASAQCGEGTPRRIVASVDDKPLLARVAFRYREETLRVAPSIAHRCPVGAVVVVEGDRGVDAGTLQAITRPRVSRPDEPNTKVPANTLAESTELLPSRQLLRLANQEEICLLRYNDMFAEEALLAIRTAASNPAHGVPDITVVDCEFQFDRKKLFVYYTAPRQVPFLRFTKHLFTLFSCRVWMHQLNYHENKAGRTS